MDQNKKVNNDNKEEQQQKQPEVQSEEEEDELDVLNYGAPFQEDANKQSKKYESITKEYATAQNKFKDYKKRKEEAIKDSLHLAKILPSGMMLVPPSLHHKETDTGKWQFSQEVMLKSFLGLHDPQRVANLYKEKAEIKNALQQSKQKLDKVQASLKRKVDVMNSVHTAIVAARK
jgi:hypothetical protein